MQALGYANSAIIDNARLDRLRGPVDAPRSLALVALENLRSNDNAHHRKLITRTAAANVTGEVTDPPRDANGGIAAHALDCISVLSRSPNGKGLDNTGHGARRRTDDWRGRGRNNDRHFVVSLFRFFKCTRFVIGCQPLV